MILASVPLSSDRVPVLALGGTHSWGTQPDPNQTAKADPRHSPMSREEEAGADGEGSSFVHHQGLRAHPPSLPGRMDELPREGMHPALCPPQRLSSKPNPHGNGSSEAQAASLIQGRGSEISVAFSAPSGSLAGGHAWVTWGVWQSHSDPFAPELQSGFPVSDFEVPPLSHGALILPQRGRASWSP